MDLCFQVIFVLSIRAKAPLNHEFGAVFSEHLTVSKSKYTHQKNNIASKNRPPQKERIVFQTSNFQVQAVCFREGIYPSSFQFFSHAFGAWRIISQFVST